MLAAWMDGSLDSGDVGNFEHHLAECGRCQAILAAAASEALFGEEAARTADAAASSDAPTDDVTVPPRGRLLAFPWRRLAWAAAPLGVAASVVLAVWVVRSSRENLPLPVSQEVRTDAVPSIGGSGGAAQERAEESAAPTAAKPVEPPAASDLRSVPTGSNETRARRQETAPAARVEQDESGRSRVADADSRDAQAVAGLTAAPPPAVTGSAGNAAPPPPAAPPPQAYAAAPEQKAAAPTGAGDSRMLTQGESVRARGEPAATVMVGSGRVSWVLARDGRITRIEEGQGPEQVAATGDVLRAGSAVSEVVAWAVGQNGAIWRTLDGRSWQRVQAPSRDDFVMVAAQGAGTALVTTAAGGRFSTNDGGRTWTREQ
jgi:hypothetical protein